MNSASEDLIYAIQRAMRGALEESEDIAPEDLADYASGCQDQYQTEFSALLLAVAKGML